MHIPERDRTSSRTTVNGTIHNHHTNNDLWRSNAHDGLEHSRSLRYAKTVVRFSVCGLIISDGLHSSFPFRQQPPESQSSLRFPADTMLVPARQQGRPCGRALRAIGAEGCEAYPFGGHPVDVRRAGVLAAVIPDVPVAEVIGHDQHNVQTVAVGRAGGLTRTESHRTCKQSSRIGQKSTS